MASLSNKPKTPQTNNNKGKTIFGILVVVFIVGYVIFFYVRQLVRQYEDEAPSISYSDLMSQNDTLKNELKEVRAELSTLQIEYDELKAKYDRTQDDYELNPCPFCGSKVELEQLGTMFRITCPGCEIETGLYSDKRDLINYWNDHSEPAESNEQSLSTEITQGAEVQKSSENLQNFETIRTTEGS